MTFVHVHAPPVVRFELFRTECPECGEPSWFFSRGWEWYADRLTCLGCGDEFSEDGRMERPFCRGWRQSNIAAAIKSLKRLLHGADSQQRKVSDD